MARGGVTAYATATGFGGAGRGVGVGGVRKDAEVEAAGRSVASGGDVLEAIARVQNAGGGEVKIPTDRAGNLIKIATVSDTGLLMINTGAVTGDLANGEIKLFDTKGKEIKTDRTVTVMVTENGIGGFRQMSSNGVFQPMRQKAEITEEQRNAILNSTVPPHLKGARWSVDGSRITGWSLDKAVFPDKEMRNAIYRTGAVGSNGVLKFTPRGPLGDKITAAYADFFYKNKKSAPVKGSLMEAAFKVKKTKEISTEE
jgi:hypothetical protein